MSHSARREAQLRADQQSAAALEAAKTARLRTLRLAKEAAERETVVSATAARAPESCTRPRTRAAKPAASARVAKADTDLP